MNYPFLCSQKCCHVGPTQVQQSLSVQTVAFGQLDNHPQPPFVIAVQIPSRFLRLYLHKASKKTHVPRR